MTDQRPTRTNVTLSTRINNLFPDEDLNTSDLIIIKIAELIEASNLNVEETNPDVQELNITTEEENLLAIKEVYDVHAYLNAMPFNPRDIAPLIDRIKQYTSTVELRLSYLEELILNGKEENDSLTALMEGELQTVILLNMEIARISSQNEQLQHTNTMQQETIENMYELNSRHRDAIFRYKAMVDQFTNEMHAAIATVEI